MTSGSGSARLALLLCALTLGGCDPGAGPADGTEPVERIVLVTIDTLRADHVGSYGAAESQTPTLDALAAEGARFATAVAPTPLTLPSHATLLTGREPPQHGIRHNGLFRLPADVVPLAEHLRASGFATSAFVSAFVLDGRFGLDRGFDHYDDTLGVLSSVGAGVPTRRGDHSVDAALAWLEQAPDRFFLWLHLYDPHAPYDAPEPFASRFGMRRYAAEVSFSDAQVARLRASIVQRWPAGTMWWVTADHGESLGEHNETTHAYTVYDATQLVPLIAAGPGVPAGRVVTGIAALSDVAPTLLELAGLPALPGATGISLAAALRDGGDSPRTSAWVETLATQLDMGWSPLLGVRTAANKYVRAPEPELYDLNADPAELENLAADHPALAAELDRIVGQQASGRPVVPSFTPDAEERAQLEALGYLEGGAPVRADPSLGQVGGPDPKHEMRSQPHLDTLHALLAQRRGAEALAAYDRIPTPGYLLRTIGASAALLAGDFERAEREARLALAVAELPEPLLVIAKVQLRKGRAADAKASLERALALDPEKSQTWLGLAFLAEHDGRTEEALQLYERARSLPNVDSEAIWRGAALLIEVGQLDAARALLARLPQSELRQPDAAQRLARAERAAKRLELARTRVEGGLRDHPRDADLLLLKADLLDQQGALKAALDVRREALAAVPGRPDVANAVAWTLGRMGRDLDEADALASNAIAQLGRKPQLLDTLATVRNAQGRHAEALALADEGLAEAQDADRVDLHFRRATALAGLGRRQEAEQALSEAKHEADALQVPWNTWLEAEQRTRGLLDAAS